VPSPFTVRLVAGWGDMDFNAHMRNTAFLDRSADARFMFFRHHGVQIADFERWRIGPVVRKDAIEYFRELRLHEEFDVTVACAGISDDASRFMVRNEFLRLDGSIAARVTSLGGWLDLDARKLVVPPEPLAAAMHAMSRTEDFEPLSALRK
jgi:acyl-CoA thioester hydrolase